ncbi:MAG: hypothetical protein M3256_27320, partial [Actinomycetota bacterium]|nr:hypothetical protein [Actinomycetota bacterium]
MVMSIRSDLAFLQPGGSLWCTWWRTFRGLDADADYWGHLFLTDTSEVGFLYGNVREEVKWPIAGTSEVVQKRHRIAFRLPLADVTYVKPGPGDTKRRGIVIMAGGTLFTPLFYYKHQDESVRYWRTLLETKQIP